MKKLKAGIIGLGVGEKHIDGYLSHPACEVVALCDFNIDKRRYISDKYPEIFITESAEQILNDPGIDIVSICSYDNYHFEQIIKAIENDKHIFVEKPLCLTEDEASEIYKQLSAKPHLKISSNLILRKSPRFIQLREAIRNREYGKLFYLEGDYNYGRLNKITEGWRGEIPFYSVILGGMIHMVDLLLWLTDEKVQKVVGMGNNIMTQNTGFKYNDFVAALLYFESGLIAKVSANFGCVYPHFHKLSVYGENATFENDWPDAKLYTSRDTHDSQRKILTEYPGTHKGDMINSFVESILTVKKPEVTKEDIFRCLDVCFAIEKSANESKIIKINNR